MWKLFVQWTFWHECKDKVIFHQPTSTSYRATDTWYLNILFAIYYLSIRFHQSAEEQKSSLIYYVRTFLRKHEQNILRDIMKVQHWGPGLALASKVDIKQPSQKATVTFGDASVSFGLSAAAALTQLYASCSAHQWRHALVYVACSKLRWTLP